MKCGPSLEPDDAAALIDVLNPEQRRPGRLTLIARFGADKVAEGLPQARARGAARRAPVVWSCDPMHGNTIKAASGYKTRPFERILAKCAASSPCTAPRARIAGGVHFEMTGQNVTECTGGAIAITDDDLADRYHTHCDPRLNAAQALELAFLLAEASVAVAMVGSGSGAHNGLCSEGSLARIASSRIPFLLRHPAYPEQQALDPGLVARAERPKSSAAIVGGRRFTRSPKRCSNTEMTRAVSGSVLTVAGTGPSA
jgi:hypothetical protein